VTAPPAPPVTPRTPASDTLCIAGALLLFAGLCVRCAAAFDPFPGWSGDPFVVAAPIVGLTPARAMLCDVLVLVGAIVALAGGALRGRAPTWWELVLAAAGFVPLVIHAWTPGPFRLDSTWMGSSWAACIAAALAARTLASHARSREVLLAGALGLGVLFALRAGVQVFLEHPETLRTFRRERDAFFASQGWSADSPMARAYERRIEQRDASAWFGMVNILAGVGAAYATGVLALLVCARAARAPISRAAGAALALAAGAALACVALAGSKGGYAALAAGLLLAGAPWLTRNWPARVRTIAGRSLGAGVFLGVPALVAARGIVGERLAELSVLFRWFYTLGASRVFAESPLLGSSPAGFKDAYARLKLPIAPEDVASPHALLFDWPAMLGLGGVALALLVLVWAVRAGRTLAEPLPHGASPEATAEPVRTDVLALTACLAVGVVGGARLEAAITTPENALTRILGLVGAGLVAAGVLYILRRPGAGARSAVAPAAAAALCLVGVAQFDVVVSTPGAILLLCLLLGLGAGNLAPVPDTRRARPGAVAASMLIVVVALAVTILPLRAMWRWESTLREAYAIAEPVAMLDQRLRTLAAPGANPADVRAWLEDLAAACVAEGLPHPGHTGENPGEALGKLRLARGSRALSVLDRARDLQPDHPPTAQAVDRLRIAQAAALKATGSPREAGTLAAMAADDALRFARTWPTSSAWGHAGSVCRAAAELTGRPDLAIEGLRAWEEASVRAPYASVYPVLLADAAAELGDRAAAGVWARRALDIDALMRLDPSQGLSDRVRARMRTLAQFPEEPL
jgi:hypothetical protein